MNGGEVEAAADFQPLKLDTIIGFGGLHFTYALIHINY